MAAFYHDTPLRVRYAETDKMGVVYHANYFPWFEEGRTNYMEAIGLSYPKLEDEGFYFPLLECACQYKQPARYGGWVIVRTWLEALKGLKVIAAYDVLDRDTGTLLAHGRTVHVFVDHDMRPVNMPRLHPEVWTALGERAGTPEGCSTGR